MTTQKPTAAATPPVAAAPAPAPAPAAAPTPAAAPVEAVKPLKAVHKITHGKNVTVEPDTIFTPTTAEEREYLKSIDAAVELTKNETKLFDHDQKSLAANSGDDIQ